MKVQTPALTAEHLAVIERLERPASDDRLAQLIHAERSQDGRILPLKHVYLGSYTAYYWGAAKRERFSYEEYAAAHGLLSDYRKALHVRDVIAPKWEDDGRPIYFADNSVEQPQKAQDGSGRTRRVLVKAPSGDLC